MKMSTNTTSIDAAWPEMREPPRYLVPQEVQEILCAPLVVHVRGRKARGETIPNPQEMQKRRFLYKVFEHLGLTRVEGRGWKVSCVSTRFRTIGDEMIPVANEGLRVTIQKTVIWESRGRLAAVR